MPPSPQPVDDWKSSLLKMLPAEVVAAYISIDGLLKGAGLRNFEAGEPDYYTPTILVVSIMLWLINYFYLQSTILPEAKKQFWLSFFAFPIWVATLGGPFLYLPLPENLIQLFGAVLAILYTVVSVVVAMR